MIKGTENVDVEIIGSVCPTVGDSVVVVVPSNSNHPATLAYPPTFLLSELETKQQTELEKIKTKALEESQR